jgi:DNA-binding transcriptional LysR family regulator
MSDKTDSLVPCLPATPPQAFNDERGCSLTEESSWEGDSYQCHSIIPGNTHSDSRVEEWKGAGLDARSDLVATVPALLLGLDLERLPLVRYTPPIPIEPTTGSLVWHERTHRDPAQRWLREVVEEAYRELAPTRL